MIDPHPFHLLALVVAAPLVMARQGKARELLFELRDNGIQTVDIGLQDVPFEEQERQILLLQIDNLVHFDTNALTRRILHENGKMIQGRGRRESRFSGRCAHLAR